jgi:hypothetical protein
MNDTLTTDDPAPGAQLIARIVDRAAAPSDYESFGALARGAPAHWEELLSALRDDDALHGALDGSLQAAERVELPAGPLAPSAPGGVLRRIGPWSGWLAAAALALVWLAGDARLEGASTDPARDGLARLSDADPRATPRLRDAPVAGDPVLAELPLRLVGAEPSRDGAGLEVLYVQPVLRRTRVDGVFEMGTDEQGRPAPVRVDPALLARNESL